MITNRRKATKVGKSTRFCPKTRAKIAEKAGEREARKRQAKAGGTTSFTDAAEQARKFDERHGLHSVTLSSSAGSVTVTGGSQADVISKITPEKFAPVVDPIRAQFTLSLETSRRVARAFREIADASARLGTLAERRAGAKKRAQALESEAESHAASDPDLRDRLRTQRMGEIAREMKVIETDLVKIATDIGQARAEIKSARKTRDALLRGEDPRGTLYEEAAMQAAPDVPGPESGADGEA